MDVDMWLVYRDFVIERHKIWERRQAGEPGPWTRDPVLASRKFTNVFRLLDFGTQFVLTDLAPKGEDWRNVLYRLFLYRHTGRVEAWQYLELALGRYPYVGEGQQVWDAWNAYRGPGTPVEKNTKPYGVRANKAGGAGYVKYPRSVFTGAYLVFPQSQERGTDKMKSITDLADRVVTPAFLEDWEATPSRADRFALLRRNKGVGDFMSMQTLADFDYWSGEDPDDFVQCGPGAVRGVAAIDPDAKPNAFAKMAHRMWLDDPDVPLLAGRPPALMDVQNTLCEFSKYVRYLRQAPGRAYEPAHPGPQEPPVLPEHWTTKGTNR